MFDCDVFGDDFEEDGWGCADELALVEPEETSV
jgi:hypothetical protein